MSANVWRWHLLAMGRTDADPFQLVTYAVTFSSFAAFYSLIIYFSLFFSIPSLWIFSKAVLWLKKTEKGHHVMFFVFLKGPRDLCVYILLGLSRILSYVILLSLKILYLAHIYEPVVVEFSKLLQTYNRIFISSFHHDIQLQYG